MENFDRARIASIREIIDSKSRELEELEERLRRAQDGEPASDFEFQRGDSFGERMADRITAFGGSWRFLGIFIGILAVWVILNSAVLIFKPVDPYPFIFLNLILSCLATLQAPIIMMSQNRQDARDRARGQYDHRVNLKSELEIRHLHDKIDYLLRTQWDRLLEIQQLQLEMIEAIRRNQSDLADRIACGYTREDLDHTERDR